MAFTCSRSSPRTAVVFDAYGTLLSNPRSSRPFAQLKTAIEEQGAGASDFAHRAMTAKHTFSSLTKSYGVSVPVDLLARLEHELMGELMDVRPYPDAERALRHVLGRGAVVVVASNLAWPYAIPVRSVLDSVVSGASREARSRVRTAFSFDVGALKPSPSFYQSVVESLADTGIQTDGVFMVGDRQEEDVEGPIRAGWKAWRVDRSRDEGLLDAPWDEWLG